MLRGGTYTECCEVGDCGTFVVRARTGCLGAPKKGIHGGGGVNGFNGAEVVDRVQGREGVEGVEVFEGVEVVKLCWQFPV